MAYSNSSLAKAKYLSPNHSGTRSHSIDRITPHCVVGQLSGAGIGGCFKSTSRQASCNYGIGTAGDIVLIVEEKNRSWCSSSAANDNRAITIECASNTTHPYAMNGNVWNSLINLCVDVCRRNGKNKLLWLGSATATLNYAPKSNEMVLSAHRWFKNKACPGDWLYSRFGTLASEVTKRLGGSGSSTISAKPAPASTTSKPAAGEFQVQVNITDLNIRKGPGTNYAKTGKKTGKGTFTITQTSSGAGSSAGWGKLKSGAGWISLDYAKKVGSTSTSSSTAKPAAAASSSYKTWVGKVTATRLNVRTGAGTNYGNLSSYPILGKGNLVDVIGTAKDSKGTTWYKIRIANKHVGYVHSSYLAKA